MRKKTTTEERKAMLTRPTGFYKGIPSKFSSMSFAVEGKYTNIDVWLGWDKPVASVNPDTDTLKVFIRLDRCKQYNVPLVSDKLGYLDKPNKALSKLMEFYTWACDVSELDKILDAISTLKDRDKNDW